MLFGDRSPRQGHLKGVLTRFPGAGAGDCGFRRPASRQPLMCPWRGLLWSHARLRPLRENGT